MQEEVENKSVNLAITTSKLTARTLWKGLQYLVSKAREKHQANVKVKNAQKAAGANTTARGKQTVAELIGQNQGVSSVDISHTDIRGFEKYARKYGVDYAIRKDASVQPPKYMVFFKARDADALTGALKEYTNEALNHRNRRKSVLKELKKYKELAASLPGKVREKIREHTR